MTFLNKYLHKSLPPLNFQSLLIITYGRSGSTLLQGILNNIEGVVVRGENFNMCFHLFQTYQSIMYSKGHNGNLTQSPFYGSELLDETYFLKQTKETVKKLLLADQNHTSSIRCYGFKEIRYWQDLQKFPDFLDFLQKIFPNVCFIFNTRDKEDVVKSWIKVSLHNKVNEKNIFNILEKTEAAFFEYIKKNKNNSFHITYTDVVGKTERLESLFSFLGAPYQEEKIDNALSLRHSYQPNQLHIRMMNHNSPFKKDLINYRTNKNIIIEKYKCIFYVLPKNACSSMKAQIVDLLGMKKGQNYPEDIHDPNIYPYPFVEKKDLINKYQDYLKFCIVRNPWDRLVSCFKDKIRPLDYNEVGFKNGVALPLIENSPLFYGGMSFEEFVSVICTLPDSIAEHHFSSQLYQITDNSGNLLINYIAKLETLNQDLNEISLITGLPVDKFPHIHKTEEKAYQKYYTDELIEKVKIRYAADIGFFNYEFGQPEPSNIGFLSNELTNKLSNSIWILPVLKEKNDYLQKSRKLDTKGSSQIFELINKVNVQNRKLEGIHNSISWKITAPLRKLGQIVGFVPKK